MTDNINETNGTQGAAQEEGGAKKAAEQVQIKGFLKAVPAILLALSLFITLCFITGETGKFGSFISSALKGLFSYMAYSIPVLIALHALFFFSDVRRRKILFRIVFSTVTLITLSMIAYIIPNLTSELVFTPGEFYENGKMNIGGGWVGGVFAYGITAVIGKIGLIIVILLTAVLYAIYFFTDGGSAMSRFFLERLADILNFGAKLEARAEEKKRRDEEARLAKEAEEADRRDAPFLEDEFFATDNGIETLEIPEIGIKETKTGFVGVGGLRSTVGRSDGEDETYTAQSSTAWESGTSTEYSETVNAPDIEARTDAPRVTITIPAVDNTAAQTAPQSNTSAASTASTSAAASSAPSAADLGIDDSADAIFTKDFDPYDIALNEKRASRASSRATENGEGAAKGFSEFIADLTPEQVERIKRIEAFEANREAALRRRAENEAMREAELKARREAEEARAAEAARAEEVRRAEEERAEEEARAQAARIAEEARAEEARLAEQARRAEEARAAVETEATTPTATVTTGYTRPATSYRYVANTVADEPRLAYSATENETKTPVTVSREPEVAATRAPEVARTEAFDFGTSAASESAFTFGENSTAASGLDFEQDESLTPSASLTFGDEEESEVSLTFGNNEIVPDDDADATLTFGGGESEPSFTFIDDTASSPAFKNSNTDEMTFGTAAAADTLEVKRIKLDPVLDADEGEDDEYEDADAASVADGAEDAAMPEIIPEEERNPDIDGYRKYFTVLDGNGDAGTDEADSDDREDEYTDDGGEDLDGEDGEFADGEDGIDEEEPPFEEEDDEDEPPFANATVTTKEAPVKKKLADYSKYIFPPVDLLAPGKEEDLSRINDEIQFGADQLINTLESFNIRATVRGIERGPRITRYSIVPAKGVRVNQIEKLSDDIALAMAAESIRIEAPIPGKSAVGVEVPNKVPSLVSLRDLIEAEEFVNNESKTAVCIGKSVEGTLIFDDIASMPHLLIAGATGMGKSVCINALITSILYKAKPDEVKFIMIDPKQVEFAPYNGIPHLLVPVVTDPKQAAGALMWAVDEMNKRYDIIKELSVKTIDSYNAKVREHPELGAPMAKIIIFIDELNDLMLQVRDPVENLIMSIAQKARAAGIHLVIGTQRPSVNVITGVIKANIPSRIACKVSSGIDSRTILEQTGAEKLIGKGDMLVAPGGKPNPKRVQGAFVSEGETERIVDFIKAQIDGEIYDEQALEDMKRAAQKCDKSHDEDEGDDDTQESSSGFLHDRKFLNAVELAIRNKSVATSFLQRKLSIGYGRAAQYIDTMEDLGIVGEKNGSKPREVLVTMDEWNEKLARLTDGY